MPWSAYYTTSDSWRWGKQWWIGKTSQRKTTFEIQRMACCKLYCQQWCPFPHLPGKDEVNKDKQKTWEWSHTHTHTHTHTSLLKDSVTQLGKKLALHLSPLPASPPPIPIPMPLLIIQTSASQYGPIHPPSCYLLSSCHSFNHSFISSIAPVHSWYHSQCIEGVNLFSVKLRPLCRIVFIFWREAGVTKCC